MLPCKSPVLACLPFHGPADLTVASSSIDLAALGLRVRFPPGTRDVVATYENEETEAELSIRISLPKTYPLKRATVTCDTLVGVSMERWSLWQRQMTTLLTSREGTIAQALQQWKQNIDKEFEGVEPCPICFTVLHAQNRQLPKQVCGTCRKKFHRACIMQWFASSDDHACPMCRQQFK